jgi:hypothetical protein
MGGTLNIPFRVGATASTLVVAVAKVSQFSSVSKTSDDGADEVFGGDEESPADFRALAISPQPSLR